MSAELMNIIEAIEREKGIERETILQALESALLSASRKTFGEIENLTVVIDRKTAEIHVTVDDQPLNSAEFGRIAAQTAKQVIIQKIREAERNIIERNYTLKLNDIVSGTVHRFEKKNVIVDLDRTEAILPRREQSPRESYVQGQTVRAVVLEVNKTSRGPEIVLSRAAASFVKKIFEMEVPELGEGIVEVKSVAREAGDRTKIAVHSKDERVDAVGACVGMRGQRVKNVVRELHGEKIDIVRWSPDDRSYITNALSPVEIEKLALNSDQKEAMVVVKDDQLSLAIGKKGQNVRLASKLTGWNISIKKVSQLVPVSELEGVGPKTAGLLNEAGIEDLGDVLKAGLEGLTAVKGIGEKTAEKILEAARQRSGETQEEAADAQIAPAEPAVSEEPAPEVPPEASTEERPQDSPSEPA